MVEFGLVMEEGGSWREEGVGEGEGAAGAGDAAGGGGGAARGATAWGVTNPTGAPGSREVLNSPVVRLFIYE